MLVVTAPGSGAEVIPFLKTWVNLPMAIGFTVIYAKVRVLCWQPIDAAPIAAASKIVLTQPYFTAGKRPVNRGAFLRMHYPFHRLLRLLCLHHVPAAGRHPSPW